MSDSMFLNNEEVIALTGKRQRGTQAQMLRAMGIEHKIRPDGRVIVLREHVKQQLGVKAERGAKPAFKPDWIMSNLKDDGIHVTPGKTEGTTGKRLIIEWTDELRAAIELAKSVRPMPLAPWLFCNRRGECYFNEETGRAGGWDTMWRNFMERVLEETKIKEHFTEHDMRAKCASDAETLEHARALLAHADGKVTERIYSRKPERVRPLR